MHDPLECLDRLAPRVPHQRAAVVQLVRQHELSRQEVPPLVREGEQRLEALQQRPTGRSDESLVVGRERIDVAQVAGRPSQVELAAQPLVHVRMAPGAQPAGRVERFRLVIGAIRVTPTALSQQPFRREPRREPAARLRQGRPRQHQVERVLAVPDLAHQPVGERVGDEFKMAGVASGRDHGRVRRLPAQLRPHLDAQRVPSRAHRPPHDHGGPRAKPRRRRRPLGSEIQVPLQIAHQGQGDALTAPRGARADALERRHHHLDGARCAKRPGFDHPAVYEPPCPSRTGDQAADREPDGTALIAPFARAPQDAAERGGVRPAPFRPPRQRTSQHVRFGARNPRPRPPPQVLGLEPMACRVRLVDHERGRVQIASRRGLRAGELLR